MPWTPSSTDLGTVTENTNFSHSISFEETDEMTLETVVYSVAVTALEENPNTVVISEDTISGYYYDSFNNLITYRTTEGTFPQVNKFEQIGLGNLYQMISYKASLERTKVFSYRADAYDPLDPETIVASQTYTKTVQNDWTQGKNSLQTYVGYTNASS
jgi:hypothetical protein